MMWCQRVNALIARDTGKNSARNFADTPVMWAPASRACPDGFLPMLDLFEADMLWHFDESPGFWTVMGVCFYPLKFRCPRTR